MELPECLHRGEVWQFSAQYDGWLSVKLLLYSHALVVDPDADTSDIRRRKRHGSVNLWMDLCLVQDIIHVEKGEGVIHRRASYNHSQLTSKRRPKFQFTLSTKQQLTLEFATSTMEQRDEWVHCLLLATELLHKRIMHEPKSDQSAFLRFASSGSEDTDEEEEHRLSNLSTSWSEESTRRPVQFLSQPDLSRAVQSSVKQAESAWSPLSFAILNITLTDDHRDSVSTIVSVSAASQESVSIYQIKLDAIRQMQAEVHRSTKSERGRLQSLLWCEADSFVLYLESENQWLSEEQQSIGRYILDCETCDIHLILAPVDRMPQPTIDLAVVGTKTKISDLSQRPYTCYVIDIIFNGTKWQITRRYKDFDVLQSHLRRKYRDAKLPGLPSKHVFTPVNGEFINYRKEQLEAFLKQLLLYPIASTDVLLMSFLGVVSVASDPELGLSGKSVIHVTSLHDTVSCGDIILFSCRFGASRLQRKFTGSKYDHIGIVVPAYAREVSNTIVLRNIKTERTPELVELLEKFVRRVEGNPYSILGIFRSASESDQSMLHNVHVGSVGYNDAENIDSSSSSSVCSIPSSFMRDEVIFTKCEDAKRKYFCSSLVASAWKELGWLQTKRKSTSFWPGSFEDGGEVEGALAPGIVLESEAVIDCRIVEVGMLTMMTG
ncbi:unnamed protein product [Peronospora belbahrii]|uniref:PX domain-containing protein n=1 Tax=Peronospora belbahrii TaxID=622444 RepID=A0ABN8CWQ5_9STRA|nr:unnamed protein product [Peronospora belbahrii]